MDELGRTLATIILFVALFFYLEPVETTKWFASIVNTYKAETDTKSSGLSRAETAFQQENV